MNTAVIIVGAGVSGLAMAMTLQRAGDTDYLVLEKASDLGGAWRDNRYPGCASDVPAHIYSFSFAPKAGWPNRYGSQLSILNYLRASAEQFGIMPHIRFNTEVAAAVFDTHSATWTVETKDGTRYRAVALVLAVGVLHQPAIPDIPGLKKFPGTAFHSARWEYSCDMSDRNVAVIGTGASAVQIIPELAECAGRLHVFQRTPPWVLPRRDKTYNYVARTLFRKVGPALLLYRWYLYWRAEMRILAFKHHRTLMHMAQIRARRHLHRQVADVSLRNKLVPGYTMGCKQLTLSNRYYPALSQSNVELVTTPITRVEGSTIVTADGRKRPVEIIVLATGFQAINSLDLIQITGPHGLTLKEAWRFGAEAFLGVCVSGFPNLFLMIGPNSGLAHTSMIFMIEDQARYIAQAIARLGPGARSLEVRAAVQLKFNSDVQRRLRRAVWSAGGCRSWHIDNSGVNRILWPNSTVSYWFRTRRISLNDFMLQ